jgi:hypothetical protein
MSVAPRIKVGEVFGRLVVTGEDDSHHHPGGKVSHKVRVRCACGEVRSVYERSLRSGVTKSCGCLQRDKAREGKHALKHGFSSTSTYHTWNAMIGRCLKPTHRAFKHYGGRGIRVCDRWKTFLNFLADMGERPKGLTLDRVDNDGHYQPENCRWTTQFVQCSNQRKTRLVVVDGEDVCLREAARRVGVSHSAISERAKRKGISDQAAVDHYAARR